LIEGLEDFHAGPQQCILVGLLTVRSRLQQRQYRPWNLLKRCANPRSWGFVDTHRGRINRVEKLSPRGDSTSHDRPKCATQIRLRLYCDP